MADEHKNESEITQAATQETEPETVKTEENQKINSSGGSAFDGIYERLPDISVKSVDRFILICVIAFVAVILIGVLKANHIF